MTRSCSGLFLGLSSGPQAEQGDAVTDPLPERPDLDQLRRQAKELRDAVRRGDAAAVKRFGRYRPAAVKGVASLASAQLVIARELGFASWPRLKAAIDAVAIDAVATDTGDANAGDANADRGMHAFLSAVIEGRPRQAREIYRADPGIASRGLLAATVLGDAGTVRERLATDPAAALTIDQERGWPPLLYACYSRWHQIDPSRESGMADVVRLLLDAGASPNTNDGGRPRYRSALKGSVEVNNPGVTKILLDAGADPDPGQPIAEAVAHRDQRCLRLLLSHGARVAGTWGLGAAVYNNNAAATSLLLKALAASSAGAAGQATEALADAAANASYLVVAALLDAGADPRATGEDGVSALRLAVRAGRQDNAVLLKALGAPDDCSDVDRFIGACVTGDRQAAERVLADHPGLRDRLTDQDRAVIVEAAASRPAEAIALMLDLGFSPRARRFGDEPLHSAAYHGNAGAVEVLLRAGADSNARDGRFEGTPLAFATVGSREQAGRPGDWLKTARLLIEAGASREGAWIPGKPPSEEVMDLLHRYGIGPGDSAERQPRDLADVPGSIGTGVMADMARHLEAAFRDRDLDLLASLLHPDVSWTGICRNSEQVLDWYRGVLADGTVPVVQSVEVDRDAVLLGLSVALQAEGARLAPPQQLYQVFTVDGAQIVDIRGYSDRASAVART
jgi:ankyrin repeat protein